MQRVNDRVPAPRLEQAPQDSDHNRQPKRRPGPWRRGWAAVGRGVIRFFEWRPMRRRGRVVSGLASVALVMLVVGFATGPAPAGWKLWSAALEADHQPVRLPPLSQGSTVYDANGRVAAVFNGSVDRRPVSLSTVSPDLVHAVIDTEDARFWQHGGVDLHAILRAAKADVGGGGALQGASTIAEQLAKTTLLAGHPDNLRNKVQEAVLANRLEKKLGKRGVLEQYLNTIYLGEGAYGVQAAAETYFGVPASAVDPAQAAMLAGLIQDPNADDPVRHPSDAAARRNTVLSLMVAQHDLRPAAAQAAQAEPLPSVAHQPPSGHDYFLDAVKSQLLADPALGATPAARYRALFYGGLQIHTTLDPRMEAAATEAVANGLPGSTGLTAAMVAVDPTNGEVPAVVGGPNFATSQFDAALSPPGRPTGSAFKVFTLVAALENGYTPYSVLDGSGPCVIPDPGGNPNPWVLSNYESENFGAIDLADATANSVNCAFARLSLSVGLPKIAQVAHQMGVQAPLAVVPSMTLGTNNVPPVQMAAAYATLADDGVYHAPHLVTEVDRPGGKVVERNNPAGVRVMSPQIARLTTSILQQVVFSGTGKAANVPGHPVAGKTGTGENYGDAWFVGYTPSLAAAVWMGSPSGEVPMLHVHGIAVAGGTYPAQMWQAFMASTLSTAPAQPFTPPEPVPGAPPPPAPAPPPPAGQHTQTTTWCWSSCGKGGPPHP